LSDTATHPTACDAGEDLLELISSFRDIPTIPEVLARIWQLVDDPRSSASDLEKVVSMEPPLAAKVLRLANSPYYGGRGRIKDVQTAITSLGFHTLRNLAICLSVASALGQRESSVSIVDHRALWQHSVAVAVLARAVGAEVGDVEPDEVFSAGLLHDLGKFVISLGRPEAYAEVVRRSAAIDLSLEAAETSVLGFDHAAVGSGFAERWHFPPRLRELILRHHEEPSGELTREKHVLRLADSLSHELHPVQIVGIEERHAIDPIDLDRLGLGVDWVDVSRDGLPERVSEAQEFMNLL
jgi:putative nucleotidyltransferase with HDIG domain